MRAPIPEDRLRKRYPASPCLIISGIFFRSLMKLLSFFLCTRRVSAKFSGAFIPSLKKSDGEHHLRVCKDGPVFLFDEVFYG